MWLLYQLAMAVTLVVAAPVLLARRGRHYLQTLPGRLGLRQQPPATGALWLHAVSVGEVAVATTVARSLPPSLPLLVTTVTPTGQERARASLGERATVAYLPFDLGFAVRRFFDRHRPSALVLVEGDYWPLVLRAAARRHLPVAVVNGRVSEHSFRRMRRLRPLLGSLFDPVGRFGMQTPADRERLEMLGVPTERITVTGNLKFEAPEPPILDELTPMLERLAGERAILVAGSTMAGEEDAVVDALTRLGTERALLVLAPRHPERFAEVERSLDERGHRFVRRSALGSSDRGTPGSDAVDSAAVDIVLLDTLGELASLYRLATAAFVGGTLVPTGGHNPLEPARFAVPTAVGPSMDNFRAIAASFDEADAWARVHDAATLAEAWSRWLDDPERANETGRRGEALAAANRGALDATLALLGPWTSPTEVEA